MARRKRIDMARFAELRAQGQTRKQACSAVGIHPVTAWRWRGAGRLADAHARSLRQRRIEAEFGEPLADVITGLRALGYSWATVAGALDITPRTLVTWRRQLGLPTDSRDRRADVDPVAEPARATYDWLRGTSHRHNISSLSGEGS